MKQTVVFFLYPGIVSLDVTGPLEVFATATALLSRDNKGTEGYAPVFAACASGQVRTSSGLALVADVALENTHPHILVVPGGPDAEQAAADAESVRQV